MVEFDYELITVKEKSKLKREAANSRVVCDGQH